MMRAKFLLACALLLLLPDSSPAQQVILSQYPPARKAATASLPVVLSTEDKAVLDNIYTQLSVTGVTVQGTKSSNDATPGVNNVGVIGCLATSNPPTWVEGRIVFCSSNLTGHTRVAEDPTGVLAVNINNLRIAAEELTNALDGNGFNISKIGGATPTPEVNVDYDTGGPVQNLIMVGLSLPGAGGAVAGGTTTNPFVVAEAADSVLSDAIEELAGAVVDGGFNISKIGGATPTPEVNVDYDSTGATQNLMMVGLALPSATGAVAGGTAANPFVVHENNWATHGGSAATIGPQAMVHALTSLSGMTLVTTGQPTRVSAGTDGAIVSRPSTLLEDVVIGNASQSDGTSTELIAAGGSGIKVYLTSVSCTNTTTVGIYVELKSGTTVQYRLPLPAANSADTNGTVLTFPVPLPPIGTANTAWNFDPSANTIAPVYCSAIGFKSKI